MSCTYRIKESAGSLTVTEKRIADYILDHKDEIIHLSSQELATLIQTSPAALIRFSKKLGYRGFTALKVDLAMDTDNPETSFESLIDAEDSAAVLIKKAMFANQKTINETYQLLDLRQLEQAIQILDQAHHIYLVGIGGNAVVCQDLLHKLSRINKNVIYHEDIHILLAKLAHIQKEDAVIAISYSGKTKEVNTAVEYASHQHAKVIAITQFDARSPLSKLADIILLVPTQEKELRLGAIASRNAALILTDLLYFGIARNNMDEVREDLFKSRELVSRLK